MIAADALGPDNVRCVMLPSEYTSQASLDDAAAVAKALGCRLDEISIEGPRRAMREALAPLFDGLAEDVTEENIQSRLRGVTLMALSNKFGEMLLTTGNKSEVAVGYATIYGDMAGGSFGLSGRVIRPGRDGKGAHRPGSRSEKRCGSGGLSLLSGDLPETTTRRDPCATRSSASP